MLAEISLNLAYFGTFAKYILIIVLLGISLVQFVVPYLLQKLAIGMIPKLSTAATAVTSPLKRRDAGRSSDTPPPAGFAEHLALIEGAAPNGNPKVWWDYAKAEMTEAEVALAEAKLAQHT